jgi:hypothetical protein
MQSFLAVSRVIRKENSELFDMKHSVMSVSLPTHFPTDFIPEYIYF